jgi:hypothetical protein
MIGLRTTPRAYRPHILDAQCSYTRKLLRAFIENSISEDEIDIERAVVLALSDDFDVISYPQAEKLGPLEPLNVRE